MLWQGSIVEIDYGLFRVFGPYFIGQSLGTYKRGTRYCWAWGKHNFETNKWNMFLETEASFHYCNWSIKMARIIWSVSTSVDIYPAYVNNWQRLGRLPFWVYVEAGNFVKQKTYSLVRIKKKNICKETFWNLLVLVWFESVFAPSSAASFFPFDIWTLVIYPSPLLIVSTVLWLLFSHNTLSVTNSDTASYY